MPATPDLSVVIVGGSTPAAIDLALELASAGLRVVLHDVESEVVGPLTRDSVPGLPPGTGHRLVESLAAGSIIASSDAAVVAGADCVILPVDSTERDEDRLVRWMVRSLGAVAVEMRDDQPLLIASRPHPALSRMVQRFADAIGRSLLVEDPGPGNVRLSAQP